MALAAGGRALTSAVYKAVRRLSGSPGAMMASQSGSGQSTTAGWSQDPVLETFKQQQKQLRELLTRTESIEMPREGCTEEEVKEFLGKVDPILEELKVPSAKDRLMGEIEYARKRAYGDPRQYIQHIKELREELGIPAGEEAAEAQLSTVLERIEGNLGRRITAEDSEGMQKLTEAFLAEFNQDDAGLQEEIEAARVQVIGLYPSQSSFGKS